LHVVKEVAPTIFEKAGPPCLYARCPEGEMTCGKVREVRKLYGSTFKEKTKVTRVKTSRLAKSETQKRLFQE
jgi:hypothetical protein